MFKWIIIGVISVPAALKVFCLYTGFDLQTEGYFIAGLCGIFLGPMVFSSWGEN